MALDENVARLFTSNAAWSSAVSSSDPTFFSTSSAGQAPKIVWIGCSDSRVPESVLTASKPGDIFTYRNIANQVHRNDDSVNSVLAYSIGQVRVEHVVIVGHTGCGGAAACYHASQKPSLAQPTDALARWLAPLTSLAASLPLESKSTDEALLTLVEENVKAQVNNACDNISVRTAWTLGRKLWVHGFVYELETGKLRDLGVSRGKP